MTQPTRIGHKEYVQFAGGLVRNSSDNQYPNIGILIGSEANYKGTYARGELCVGTALTGKMQLGHEFELTPNLGLDVSTKAQVGTSYIHNYISERIKTDDGTEKIRNFEWCPSDARVGAAAQLSFKSKLAKIGLGLEGGVRHDILVKDDVTNKSEDNTLGRSVNKGYVTPTVSADVKLGKSNFSYVANADIYQGQVGIRYTF